MTEGEKEKDGAGFELSAVLSFAALFAATLPKEGEPPKEKGGMLGLEGVEAFEPKPENPENEVGAC